MKFKIRFIHIAILIILTITAMPVFPASVEIKGKRADVDLSDLISVPDRVLTETEIKKLCVRITEKYHNLGYSAFYIREVKIKKNGDIELSLCDPVVERVLIKGEGVFDSTASVMIYREGAVFNEFILKGNIGFFKKQYSVKKVRADLNRTENGDVEIVVNVTGNSLSGQITAASEPVYGGSARVELAHKSRTSGITGFMEYADGPGDAGYKNGGFKFSYRPEGVKYSLSASMDFIDSDEYLDDKGDSTYSAVRGQGEAGITADYKAWSFTGAVVSSYAEYDDYPLTGGGASLTGISLKLMYDDKKYRVDPLDAAQAVISCRSGWNNIESKQALKLNMTGNISFPLVGIFSVGGGVFSTYTNEDMRIFHSYIYDREFPCRNEDFSTSPWRVVPRFGIKAGIYDRLFYISPEYISCLYDNDGKTGYLQAAGIRILLITENFRSMALYTIGIGEKISDGVIMVSAGASF
ncbi:MAG TPA: hypothetical protein PK906_00875 [Spirochaetota bacterium]|nr:hypothetical protein [Spirochaetota bacterium]